MSITLGVFDVFTYTIPGSLYLALLAYISTRFRWVNIAGIWHDNTTLALIVATLGSYLIGHITYNIGRALARSVRVGQKNIADARIEFLKRVPAAKDRPFLQAHRSILQAAVEVRQLDAALEIIRLRAVGLMLRNSAAAFALGSIVALVEIVASNNSAFAASCCIVLLLAAGGSEWNSARLSHWADMKTLEVAFWIPGIDQELLDRNTHDPKEK